MTEERSAKAPPPAEAAAPEAAPPTVAEEAAGEADLDALLADVTRERDEYLALAQRARADFDNFRKRSARDVADAERRGKTAVARDLVPVIDNLERALLAAGVNPDGPDTEEIEASTQEVSAQQALTQGVALVYRELKAALQRAGVEAYDPAGERFDPQWHEALSTLPAEDAEAGTVVETLEKGYRLDGQVLRAARVVVAG
ncbi:MAG: nucleotide exchange factor GrpE [Solirubrobacterales bacterium]